MHGDVRLLAERMESQAFPGESHYNNGFAVSAAAILGLN